MEFGREPASSCSSLLASWMIGQILASNQLRTSSELAPNMFGASSELASVMEFGFYQVILLLVSKKGNQCYWRVYIGDTETQCVQRGIGN